MWLDCRTEGGPVLDVKLSSVASKAEALFSEGQWALFYVDRSHYNQVSLQAQVS